MSWKVATSLLWLLIVTFVPFGNGDGERIHEQLDRKGKFLATWEVEFSTKVIIFDLIVETTGYVGLGFSVHGGMKQADIMIGGVSPNGKPYIGDYYGIGNTIPKRDAKEDWVLLSATENSTHTSLRAYRPLDTCDDEDVILNSDTLNVIWAYGQTDDLTYHGVTRGTHVANLLDGVTVPKDTSDFKQWDIIIDTPMPSTLFSYWCTIHRSPFHGKNHIIGFKPYVNTPIAIEHTHHFVIYKCESPNHDNSVFEKYVGDPGAECYGEKEMRERPTQFCKNILYDWGAGGKELYLPEHVGFPVGEKETEYYMLEIHYNNPQRLKNVQFSTGVSVIYTEKLRKYDAGMFTVGHTVVGSLLIPPHSKDFMIVGHCSPECTGRGIPREGVKIFNVLLHTHLTGRKMKFRHFRENKELEWIAKDDSYHFNFQKNRPLRKERKLLPRDQLTFECTYDTSKKPNVTIAGFSTINEMCEVFVWYYPKIPMVACSSFYDIQRLLSPFGIKKVRWVRGFNKDSQPIVMEPAHMANKTFAEYLDSEIRDWDTGRRSTLQNELHYSPHISDCSSAVLPKNRMAKPSPTFPVPLSMAGMMPPGAENELIPRQPPPEFVGYPNVHEYEPFAKCPPKEKQYYMKR